MLLKNSEIGIYHAGIEVYGEEWSFQYFEDTWNDPTISGIIRCAPKQMSGYEYQESLNLGPTTLSEEEVDDLLDKLCDEYAASTYHLTHRNCLTFAQHLAASLKPPRPFPDWILGILEASTRLGAVDATVDYFWSWAKWYMIRKHEPAEDPPPQPPPQQAGSWSMLGLYPTCSPSMCPGPAKDAHDSESAPPAPPGMQAVNLHDESTPQLSATQAKQCILSYTKQRCCTENNLAYENMMDNGLTCLLIEIVVTGSFATERPGCGVSLVLFLEGERCLEVLEILPRFLRMAGALLVVGFYSERFTLEDKQDKDEKLQKEHGFAEETGVGCEHGLRDILSSSASHGKCTECGHGQDCLQQVSEGLQVGYRVIDTASHYENEPEVAEAVRRAELERDKIYLITKIWFDDMGDRAPEAIQESLRRLNTDYVDLLLMHFPGANDVLQSPAANRERRERTWRAMEDAKSQGRARSIGVANFTRRHLKELFEYCREPPAVLQTEIHPYFQQSKLVDFSKQNGLQIQSFSPLAHGDLNLLEDKVLKSIASTHQKSSAQVVLRWLLQQNISPIVFSRSRQRLVENLDTNFRLSDQDMDRISFLDRDSAARVGFDPNLIA
ncbi:unnamed protein product [Symbiodinium natans]|uniref:PPPDE domain-containing protein n=1 Tax=Symbiodinium natans TaxID=878477 RepID=A0A812UGH0_9DINO|nr:unnamed protein product [Symbiodinium natans]